MEPYYILYALVVYLPLAICGITGVANLIQMKKGILLRLLTSVLCMVPVVAAASNAWNFFPNNIELILFYLPPIPLLLLLITGLIFRKQCRSSVLDSVLLGLSAVSSGWIAVFIYLSSQIP